MILYTIQAEEKFKQFQETGLLIADELFIEPHFLESYKWIEKKMVQLLNPCDIKVKHPIWAWYKKSGKRKPDLRKCGYLGKNNIGYRIEIEIPDNDSLLTDFEDWHLILNATNYDRKVEHCCLDVDEMDENDIQQAIENKWILKDNKIFFDWNNIILKPDSTKEYIQATIWYVKLSQVRSYTKFTSR